MCEEALRAKSCVLDLLACELVAVRKENDELVARMYEVQVMQGVMAAVGCSGMAIDRRLPASLSKCRTI